DVPPMVLCAYCFESGGRNCHGNFGQATWSSYPPDWNDDRCRYWSVLNFDPLSTVSNGVLLSFSPPPGSPYPAGCLTYTFTASPGRQRMPVLPCNTIASPNYFLFTMIMVLPISTIDADIIINFNQTDQGRWFLCNGNNANCPFWV